MADFLVVLQIFQKESNFEGVSVVLTYEQGSILHNIKIESFGRHGIQNGYMLFLTCLMCPEHQILSKCFILCIIM